MQRQARGWFSFRPSWSSVFLVSSLHFLLAPYCAALSCASCVDLGMAYCAELNGMQYCGHPGVILTCDNGRAMSTNMTDCVPRAPSDARGEADGVEPSSEESVLTLGYTMIIAAICSGIFACLIYFCCLFFAVDVLCAPRRRAVGVARVGSFASQLPSTTPSACSHNRVSTANSVLDDIEMVQTVPRLCDDDEVDEGGDG